MTRTPQERAVRRIEGKIKRAEASLRRLAREAYDSAGEYGSVTDQRVMARYIAGLKQCLATRKRSLG